MPGEPLVSLQDHQVELVTSRRNGHRGRGLPPHPSSPGSRSAWGRSRSWWRRRHPLVEGGPEGTERAHPVSNSPPGPLQSATTARPDRSSRASRPPRASSIRPIHTPASGDSPSAATEGTAVTRVRKTEPEDGRDRSLCGSSHGARVPSASSEITLNLLDSGSDAISPPPRASGQPLPRSWPGGSRRRSKPAGRLHLAHPR